MSALGYRAPADRAANIAAVAVFAAVIVALGAIFIPLPFSPVPVTGQTLGVLLAANVLGPKRGAASVLLVLLLAAAGVPVIAGGRAGLGVLLGPSGGFFVGFVAAALAVGLGTQWLRAGRSALAMRIVINCTLGVFTVYLLGVPWLALLADRPLTEAMAAGMVPFIPGDVFKAVLAALAAQAVLSANGFRLQRGRR